MVIHGLGFRFVIDDAFISFRYAQNLVAGHGLVFNPGERVEGYSNLLYVLYSALGLKLGLDPLLWSRIGSTLAMGGALALLPGIVRQMNPRAGSWAGLTAQLVLAAVGAVACWMLAGLETAFFTLFVVWAWRAALHRQCLAAGLVGLLMILTRPEGPALAALFMGWALWSHGRASAPSRGSGPTWLGPAVLVLGTAAFFLWRHTYFGYWLPNTYFAKTGDLTGQLKTGGPYTWAFLLFYGLPLAVALVLSLRRGAGAVLRSAQVWPGLGIVAFWALYTTAVGGDMLGMFRFYVPVLPLLTTTVVALLAETGWLDRPRSALTVAVILMMALLPATFQGKERRLVDIHMSEANLGGWFLAGDALAEQLPAGSTIALGPAGYIPYITGFRTWDFYGIVTPKIAHRDMPFNQGYAGHEKHDGAYIVSQRPDYILIGNVDVSARPRQGLIRPHVRELDIVQNKTFQREYEQVYLPVAGGKVLNLFRRKP
jgi:hypothetical protein